MVPGAAGRIPRAEVARYRLPESIQWFIEDQTSPPLPVSRQYARQATHRKTDKERHLADGRWGRERGRIIRQRETNSPILSGVFEKYVVLQMNEAAVNLRLGLRYSSFIHRLQNRLEGEGKEERGPHPSDLMCWADGHLVRGPNWFLGGGAHSIP
jgi:hypothetical protein